jgi:hypothetical protein
MNAAFCGVFFDLLLAGLCALFLRCIVVTTSKVNTGDGGHPGATIPAWNY